MASGCAIFCEILIAILLPPLGVCLRHGCCTVEFFICLVLTILGYIPGIIYALYAIACLEPDRVRGDYYQLVRAGPEHKQEGRSPRALKS